MDILPAIVIFAASLLYCLLRDRSLAWALALTFLAVPYACYLYLIPVCYFLTQRLFFPKTE